MLIHRMVSIFENLENNVLELSPGLNILQAPGEAGKSAWCAFLLSMFYGAEHPGESGGPDESVPCPGVVSGRLDCQAGDREFTLLRATRQGGPPLGEFRALAGGTVPAPDLTAENCGETLLGAKREEYVQSALIGPKEQDPELARRIASLLPSFAEPGEFSGAVQEEVAFHRQGRTGLLPALEAELRETTALLATQEALASRLESQSPQREVLAEQTTALEEELASLDRWESYQQGKAYRQAEALAIAAEEKAAAYRIRLDREGVPELSTVSRLRGAIVNLNTTRKNSEQTRIQREQASAALLEAETRLNESPFADMTKEEALAAPLRLRPKPRFPHWGVPLLLALGIASGVALYLIRKSIPMSLSTGCGLSAVLGLFLALSHRRKLAQWEEQAAQMRSLRESDLAEWERLLKAAESARADNTAKSAAWETLQSTLVATEQGIMQEVRRFAPGATDIPSADAALRAAAVLRKELADADAAAREARVRCSMLPTPEQIPDGPVAEVYRSREDIRRELEQTRTAQASLHSELDRLTGRLQSIGDPAVLRRRTEALADQIGALEKAYTALSETLTALEEANSKEQTLLLGRRTVEIFAGLICGTPDASPEESNSSSEGIAEADASAEGAAEPEPLAAPDPADTSDQLYLALRLAACQLALPSKPPLILDDALSGLDGADCEAALRWLQGAAKERQILLFTSHHREADYFRSDPSVNIQQLAVNVTK